MPRIGECTAQRNLKRTLKDEVLEYEGLVNYRVSAVYTNGETVQTTGTRSEKNESRLYHSLYSTHAVCCYDTQ